MAVKDFLSDHEYDGIREYDNPTPGWWHAIFIATIFFSFFYFVYWEMNPNASSPQSRWAAAQTREYKRLFGALGDLQPDEATILKMMGNEQMLNVAQGFFQSTCTQCHAKDGGGNVGVNLTDEHYKNVKKLDDLYNVITNGANAGVMPSWKNQFNQNERVILAAYVASLRGTKPASAKAPEGDPIPPWPAAK
ncbi:MAG: c-type cytochrome [Phycisphaerae bacterium]|nr:c-type cytochrome [Phycisphaerae bacterium]